MRRYTKRQIMKVFSDMACVHQACELALRKQDYQKLLPLLTKCQELAILAGNTIESSEQQVVEGTPLYVATIKKLEEYCELSYQLSVGCANVAEQETQCLTDDERRRSLQRMEANAGDVAEYVQEYIAETLEVAFFPYKASMWDCLESVWQAARADKNCDAYVVPVPYFDKNADGSITTMHYEGDEFPPYVPITDWKEYKTAERHPDIIYIHNPYDNANRVTTVYADYYAKELKKHTDMLVYIPYFVCVNDNVPKHLCVLPGTMYADKVIVQSERVKEKYIRAFQSFEAENNCEGMFGDVEQKFVALGSPKCDKVLSTKRENVVIPESWLEKIKRPDGTWKKVIFYNTSVAQLLEGNERVLTKLRLVFGMFRDRDDLVLLWRPHPLSSATCNAMRPQLLKQYEQIVEQYKKENWGIYDDTPELHRSIALSDAYYGDMSSLVELYRLTGKPILIQDVEIE